VRIANPFRERRPAPYSGPDGVEHAWTRTGYGQPMKPASENTEAARLARQTFPLCVLRIYRRYWSHTYALHGVRLGAEPGRFATASSRAANATPTLSEDESRPAPLLVPDVQFALFWKEK
jgi:hypothetical protein